MVKQHSISQTFPYSWTQVAQLFFHRYPNPFSTHVLSCDTISWSVTTDGNLYTKRLMTKVNKVPRRGKIIYYMCPQFHPKAYVVEESLIDLKNRIIYKITRNIGFSTKFMAVTEVNVYQPHGVDPLNQHQHQTMGEQRGHGRIKLRRRMEAFGVHRFSKNAVKAHKGFMYVLDKHFKTAEPEDNQGTKGQGSASSSSSTSNASGNVIEKFCSLHNCKRLLARFLSKIS